MAPAALHQAFDQGVNYFDVAPRYGDGDAEIKMGIGLTGLDRAKYFLACKTHERDQAGARAELDRSLQRLRPTTSTWRLRQIRTDLLSGDAHVRQRSRSFHVRPALMSALSAL